MADTSTSTSTSWTQPMWNSYFSGLSGLLGQKQDGSFNPLPTYGGPTVAPFTQAQNTALDMGLQYATNGTPAGNAANAAIVNQAQGVANPYASQTNPYAGNNPYLQNMLDASNADIVKNFQLGTAAQRDAAMARGGAYGGSAYNEMTGLDAQGLAKALAQNESNVRGQNYYNSANLAQQGIQNQIGAFDNTQNRSLQAASLGLGSQGVDQSAINNLFNLGQQQQGYTQNILNGMQNQFSNQVQSNFLPYDIYGNALSRAQGNQVTTTNSVPGSSGWAHALGAILAGVGLFGG